MEHLAIHWRTSRWQSNPLVEQRVKPIVIPLELPTETPPRLRSISLTNVVPADWNAVVFPTIERLHIDAAVDDPDLLRGILETCPRLCPSASEVFASKGLRPLRLAFSIPRGSHMRRYNTQI
ncbi:hypothetical protein AURDEDRAFT_166114 [Auricularia subglabra TFB-10046 SS5]|nr:hypothetical protein AURDEDRAFT_166114 [Auricularia subglabra TFB-10046 SS5]